MENGSCFVMVLRSDWYGVLLTSLILRRQKTWEWIKWQLMEDVEGDTTDNVVCACSDSCDLCETCHECDTISEWNAM